ncbi:hypothetical protein ABPG75_004194 [Micractinium tetrahymenae]
MLRVHAWDIGRPQQAVATAPLPTVGGPDLRAAPTVNLEGRPVPLNTHAVGKAGKEPFVGKVLEIRRLGGRNRERYVSELVIDTGCLEFHEGQAFGVLPPGTKLNSKGQEVPQHVRLYSIASSRYGDRHDGRTCTLCVVRVVWTGEHKRGVCSNYISDRKVGDEMLMTGPSGTAMLLPNDHFRRPIVCVSTGTGIAPFRSFWRCLFYDRVPGQEAGYQLDSRLLGLPALAWHRCRASSGCWRVLPMMTLCSTATSCGRRVTATQTACAWTSLSACSSATSGAASSTCRCSASAFRGGPAWLEAVEREGAYNSLGPASTGRPSECSIAFSPPCELELAMPAVPSRLQDLIEENFDEWLALMSSLDCVFYFW